MLEPGLFIEAQRHAGYTCPPIFLRRVGLKGSPTQPLSVRLGRDFQLEVNLGLGLGDQSRCRPPVSKLLLATRFRRKLRLNFRINRMLKELAPNDLHAFKVRGNQETGVKSKVSL